MPCQRMGLLVFSNNKERNGIEILDVEYWRALWIWVTICHWKWRHL